MGLVYKEPTMDKDITLEEIKKLKVKVEEELLWSLQKFQDKTGVAVSNIVLNITEIKTLDNKPLSQITKAELIVNIL